MNRAGGRGGGQGGTVDEVLFRAAKKTPSALHSSSGTNSGEGLVFGIYVFSISSHHRLSPLIKILKMKTRKVK